MFELFKENNPSWCKVSVVLTDKDMTERGCFSDAFPGVSLQICLFHVKRNFRREITGGKYNITSSEREEYLEYMQRTLVSLIKVLSYVGHTVLKSSQYVVMK